MAALDIAYVYPETSSPVTLEVREFVNPSYYKYGDFAICRGTRWSFLVALKSSHSVNIDLGLIEPTLTTSGFQQFQRITQLSLLFTAITNLNVIYQDDPYEYGYSAVYFNGTAGGKPIGYIKGFRYVNHQDPSAFVLSTNQGAQFCDPFTYGKTSSERAAFFDNHEPYEQIGLLFCVAQNTSTSNWRILARAFYVNSNGTTTAYNTLSVTADGSMYEDAPLKIAPIRGTVYFLVAYETGMRIVNAANTGSLTVGSEFTHGIYDHGDGVFELAYDGVNSKGLLWDSQNYISFSISGTTITTLSSGANPAGLGSAKAHQYANSTVHFVGNSTASPAGFAATILLPSGVPMVARPTNASLYAGDHAFYEDMNGSAAPPSMGLVATDGADRLYLRLFGLSGEPEVPGEFEAEVPQWTAAFDGTNHGVIGDFAATVPWLSVEFSGTNFMLGSFDVSIPKLTARFNGGGALGAVIIPGIAVSFSGTAHHYGNMDVALPRITAALSGQVDAFSEISARLPVLRVKINGARPEYSGYFAADFPVISARFRGMNDLAGEFSVDLPSFGAWVTGQKQQVSGNPLAFSRDTDASSGTPSVLDQNNILQFER